MFQRPPSDTRKTVTIVFEDRSIAVPAGETVSAALVIADVGSTRNTPVTGAPRSAYCLMGVCFECLMEIDGIADRQACMVEVKEGMRIARQFGAGSVMVRDRKESA